MNAKKTRRMNILLAYDGSQHAQAAIKLVQDLALPPKSKVHVLQVFSPGKITVVSHLEHSLKEAEDELRARGIDADSDLVLGYPSEKIVEISNKTSPDLIVMGAKGLRATLGILLGGVAQQVVEYACCPVLVVRAPYRGLHHILLCTDGSRYSQRAARYLGTFPLPENVEVGVLHVLAPVPYPIGAGMRLGGWHDIPQSILTPEEEARITVNQEAEGNTLLYKTCDLLLKKGVESTPVMVRGDAATEIIKYTDAEDVDLIVSGSRGLSTFRGWLMGSVSRKLVHYSNCSVLIVRQPETD